MRQAVQHAMLRCHAARLPGRALLRLVWRRTGLKRWWAVRRFVRLQREWAQARLAPAAIAPAQGPVRILLIPPDPVLLVASRGDQAMLLCLIRLCKASFDDPRFLVATAHNAAHRHAVEMGMKPCRVLDSGMPLVESVQRLLDERITHCITVGADVFDGSDDPVFSGRLLMLTDLLAQAGVRSTVNGFSFSADAYPGLAPIFERASRRVTYNLRDPVSYRRFVAFCAAPAALTADIAFLLKPGPVNSRAVDNITDWVDQQHALQRTVLGANIHPLLLELDQRGSLPKLVSAFAAAAARAVQQCGVSIVLLEHDFRGPSSDSLCLNPLEAALRAANCGAYLYRNSQPLSAQELKQASSALDGVATGRMHLAVAALGSGVPVLAFGYKGKMEGLLEHFGLPGSLCIAGADLTDPDAYFSALKALAQHGKRLATQVQGKLPQVTHLARQNLRQFPDAPEREVPRVA